MTKEKVIDYGGDAFPCGTATDIYTGMTLREWYAGLAMKGFLSNTKLQFKNTEEVSDISFKQADSMIERSKKP